MKKFFIGVFIGLFSVATANAATYYTCATSGTNLTTDASGGGTCKVGIGTWNVAGNIVIVRTTLTLTSAPFNMACNITIIDGGTLTYDSGINKNQPSNAFNILAGKIMIVNGDFILIQNNCELSIAQTGLLIVNANGSVNNGGNGNTDIIINGDITGAGEIDFGGGISGSGTINGQPAGGQSPPIMLSETGLIWDGTSWSPSAPVDLIDRAIFTGNY